MGYPNAPRDEQEAKVVELEDAGHAPLDSRVNVAKLLKDRALAAHTDQGLNLGLFNVIKPHLGFQGFKRYLGL